MTAPWDAFVSAAPADRAGAETIRRGLGARGFSVCPGPVRAVPEKPWRAALRQAIHGAATFLVLVGAERPPTEAQLCERQAILEAFWADPAKRLIPVLLGDAALPPFLRSVFPANERIAAYRVRRPRRDWPAAVADLAAVLAGDADLRAVGEVLDTAAEDRARRRQRFAIIRRFAERLPA